MSKPIRIHLRKNGKQTFCGLAIHEKLSIANKGEVFFELNKEPIEFNKLCRNCGSLFAKNPINRSYIDKVKENEKIKEYTDKLPKTIRSMNYYKKKLQLNWNNKNSAIMDKLLQVKVNVPNYSPIFPIDSNTDKKVNEIIFNELKDQINKAFDPNDQIIELTPEMEVNPIEVGQKTDKGKIRELKKNGLLPVSMKYKQIPEAIDRIEDGHPIAIVRGFNNSWKVIEEFCSINNPNNSNVKELTGWIDIQLARKVYNQAIINRLCD